MERLNLPDYKFRTRLNEQNKMLIFDPVRKKEVILTPEEWVRQNIIRFLIEDRQFPPSLISIESLVKVNRLTRRFDALVYDNKGKTLVLIECKAPSVEISQNTFDQIISYNLTLQSPYLLITNGLKHFFCRIDQKLKKYIFAENIPYFNDLYA